MPRLTPALIARAQRVHPYLPLLLRPCRDLDSARNELRWLREYVQKLRSDRPAGTAPPLLWQLCKERSRGRPLQYILGTQPFGELDILCRRGVLIPRPETEATTFRLASLLREAWAKTPSKPLAILDVGTGSGCIPLLLYSLLHRDVPQLTVIATDISERALQLTRRNLEWNIARGLLPAKARSNIEIVQMDVTSSQQWETALGANKRRVDVLVSNPPYISRRDLSLKTERSVRLYEPRAALVGQPALYNYINAWIIKLAQRLDVSVMLIELDSSGQALALLRYWWAEGAFEPRKPGYNFDVWDNHGGSQLKRLSAGKRDPVLEETTRAVLLCKSEIIELSKNHDTSQPMPDTDPGMLPQFEQLIRADEGRSTVTWLSTEEDTAAKLAEAEPGRQTQ